MRCVVSATSCAQTVRRHSPVYEERLRTLCGHERARCCRTAPTKAQSMARENDGRLAAHAALYARLYVHRRFVCTYYAQTFSQCAGTSAHSLRTRVSALLFTLAVRVVQCVRCGASGAVHVVRRTCGAVRAVSCVPCVRCRIGLANGQRGSDMVLGN